MQKLNTKEKAIMDAIEDSIAKSGFAPSVRDLCRMLGYRSTSTVQMYLNRLEDYGYIRREDGKSRSISLCRENARPCRIPLLCADAPLDAPLYETFIEKTLDFCYCGDLPVDAEIFAHHLPSKETNEVAVVLRQKGEKELRRLAVFMLF
ncbi:MAG: hypothetical protein IKJ35_01280 [Clostridia bacterium]|nr:hypothetical protein [Clostridia bacterium]